LELRDLVVTPFVIIIVYVLAFMVRPLVTDDLTRIYFFPALTVKIIGAIALGFIYQFYYSGGDTFSYQLHGSREIWGAFFKEPGLGMRLFFAEGKYQPGFYGYTDSVHYFYDPSAYIIVRIATILDFFTFSTYSGTAVLFAVLGFSGGWMLFITFYKRQPELHRWLAISTLFIPSVVFWGSGILKDTVTLAFLGIATYCFHILFIERKIKIGTILLFLLSLYLIFAIKKYILVSFMAAVMVWLFFSYFLRIQTVMLRIIILPFVFVACIYMAYVAVDKVVEDDPKYSLDKLAETARTTAYDIRYWSGKDAGSGYTLGELDGTLDGMLKLAPEAINVSLFRPYLWEVRNPLMLLSAIESLSLLLLTLYVLFSVRAKIFTYLQTPEVAFCLVFSMIFAFGVGISTYNFGTLARYKIPLLPFYALALGFVYNYWKRDKAADALDSDIE
jgi:hypothetical protein